jgi:hypothetical protein
MGEPPFPSASIDRIDGSKGYCAENCRWADVQTQTVNRRTTKWLTIDGETKPLTEWARQVGVGPKTIHYRLKKGLSHKDAVFLPTDRGRRLR